MHHEMSIAANLAGKAINISKNNCTSCSFLSIYIIIQYKSWSCCKFIFEKFFKFNYTNIENSETNFNLLERYNLIFNLFEVKNIDEFCSKIILIKKKSLLEDNLIKLNINVKGNINNIVKGVNMLRLGNNPVKISEKNIIR